MPMNGAGQRVHSYRVHRYAFESCDLPGGKSLPIIKILVQPLAQKYFASPRRANQGHNRASSPKRGRVATIRNVAVDAVDVRVAQDERSLRTAKSCGPAPNAGAKLCGVDLQSDGGKTPTHRGAQ
jgi:hypothetical protein